MKYTMIYMGGNAPEADREQNMKDWMAYIQGLGKAYEGGAPFSAGKIVSKDGVQPEGDKKDVSGYSVIEAKDLDEACKMAQRAPHIAFGGMTLVKECIDMKM